MQQELSTKKRIQSIDILRGIVMIIMALDHVRDFIHFAAFSVDPLDPATTTPVLYATRWITHFCAPTFIFLSGTSAYLQGLRKTKSELSKFLLTRGLWLIAVELLIISLAWSFNPFYHLFFLQVIWAIGISMVVLGVVIHLPFRAVLWLGLAIVLGHNLLDIPESKPGFTGGFWWDLLHHGHFSPYPIAENRAVIIIYPFLPWAGLMMLGYCAGIFFSSRYTPQQRASKLTLIGAVLLVVFLLLRFTNAYGDPSPWAVQQSNLRTAYSFFNVSKYPPSLLFMCITLGPVLLLLPLLEKMRNGFTQVAKVYGRVPFLYYIAHLYLAHLVAVVLYFMRGHTWHEGTRNTAGAFFYFSAPGEGYRLWVVYLVWIGVVAALYPLCRWYDKYKTSHPGKWWLSYL